MPAPVGGDVASKSRGALVLGGVGKIADKEGAAARWALHRHLAAMRLDNTSDNPKAQPRADWYRRLGSSFAILALAFLCSRRVGLSAC